MNNKRHYVFCGLAIVIFLLTLSPTMTPAGSKVKTITFGLVSIAFQDEIEKHFRDFILYVARKLSSSADVEGRVVVASTALQLVKLLDENKVDFYMESPYPTYLINRQGAAVMILRRWKGGLAEYRSLMFAKRDSGITRIEDLRGKMIAFEDPGSTSGYFLPKVLLLKAARNRLTAILLSMDRDEAGRRILKQTDNTTKFDRLPGGEEMLRRRLVEVFRPRGSR